MRPSPQLPEIMFWLQWQNAQEVCLQFGRTVRCRHARWGRLLMYPLSSLWGRRNRRRIQNSWLMERDRLLEFCTRRLLREIDGKLMRSLMTLILEGARDFRFPYEAVLPAVELIFPNKILRGGKAVHQGTFFWNEPDSTQVVSRAAEFMSPTKSRPREGWISQVPKFSCFDSDRMPSGELGIAFCCF